LNQYQYQYIGIKNDTWTDPKFTVPYVHIFLQTIKKLPEYDIVEGAPKQLSELNKGIQDYLFQADILASADEIRELTSSLNVRSKRKANNDLQEKWPVKKQGVIPYILDNSLSTFLFQTYVLLYLSLFQLITKSKLSMIRFNFGRTIHV
jgi:hypothetical protein